MQEREVRAKLLTKLSDYFSVDQIDIDLNFSLVGNNIISKAEEAAEHEQMLQEKRKKELHNNPFIQEAEQLFGTKVDKIIID